MFYHFYSTTFLCYWFCRFDPYKSKDVQPFRHVSYHKLLATIKKKKKNFSSPPHCCYPPPVARHMLPHPSPDVLQKWPIAIIHQPEGSYRNMVWIMEHLLVVYVKKYMHTIIYHVLAVMFPTVKHRNKTCRRWSAKCRILQHSSCKNSLFRYPLRKQGWRMMTHRRYPNMLHHKTFKKKINNNNETLKQHQKTGGKVRRHQKSGSQLVAPGPHTLQLLHATVFRVRVLCPVTKPYGCLLEVSETVSEAQQFTGQLVLNNIHHLFRSSCSWTESSASSSPLSSMSTWNGSKIKTQTNMTVLATNQRTSKDVGNFEVKTSTYIYQVLSYEHFWINVFTTSSLILHHFAMPQKAEPSAFWEQRIVRTWLSEHVGQDLWYIRISWFDNSW